MFLLLETKEYELWFLCYCVIIKSFNKLERKRGVHKNQTEVAQTILKTWFFLTEQNIINNVLESAVQ